MAADRPPAAARWGVRCDRSAWPSDVPRLFPAAAERIDKPFLLRLLTSFGPDKLVAARDLLSVDTRQRATDLMQRLAGDERFLTCGRSLGQTLLHGDLYGLNVLLPSRTDRSLVIDWNVSRIGPPMFDVAMSAPYDSDGRRAHDEGWAQVAGEPPDQVQDHLAHAWCSTMINIGFAGVVALRSTATKGAQMVADAVEAADRWEYLSRRPLL